jgi:rubrerythrin
MKKAAKKPMKKAEAAPGAMEKKVVYKCEHCNQTADKPGKCPMCGMDMKKS